LQSFIDAGAYPYDIMVIQRMLFKVVGMYCATCKPIVEKQLRGEQAIKKIDIDFMTDSVIVQYDADLITKEQIKKRLEDSGYEFVRVANM
jgi:copper chaperone